MPPRRNCTVSFARVWFAALDVGVRPMSVMRSSKHAPGVPAPVQVPLFGRKSERVNGTPPVPCEKTIFRPGHTVIAGARAAGDAATGEAFSARFATGSVYPRTRPAFHTGLRLAGFESSGSDSSMNVPVLPGTGVGVGVPTTGVAVGPPGVGVSLGVAGGAVTVGRKPPESSWKLLSEPLQIDPAREVAVRVQMARDDRADLSGVAQAAGERRDGGRGEEVRVALEVEDRLEGGLQRSAVGRREELAAGVGRDAVQGREEARVGVQADHEHRDSGDPTLGSAAWASVRGPGTLSGSATWPRSPDGPSPVVPPTHGSEEHSSWPSVTYTTM